MSDIVQIPRAFQRKRNVEPLLIDMMGDAVRVQGGGVKLTRFTRQGTVNYKRVPELAGLDLDPYRAPATEAVRVTVMEE